MMSQMKSIVNDWIFIALDYILDRRGMNCAHMPANSSNNRQTRKLEHMVLERGKSERWSNEAHT